ncbi:TonB-dependent receptor [Rhizorhapis sp. SPR117]|uniref:TonB-dependent receptor n=1 Tax=Rhizorhapis sp. SPR117 TaxID=2912611 RepID=UPI001F15BB44|nr:TonB-dependent receptor [Rhizorhapis sp. SPR117]
MSGWHSIMLRDDTGDTGAALRLDASRRLACVGISTLAIAASLLALPVAAFAQTADSQADQSKAPNDGSRAVNQSPSSVGVREEGGRIEEIVVTAEKRQSAANRVGMSITAISGDALLERGVFTPDDLVKAVPGFNYTRSSYGVPVYTLRGIGFYDTSLGGSPTVSVYTDEVPLPYSIMTTGAGLDMERVEVLKGPQGILFGQNSTGGAINFIAAKPTDYNAAGADVSYDSQGLVNLQGFVSGPISDTLAIRVAARTEQGGNWQRSYTRDDRQGQSTLMIGRVLLAWEPTADLSVQLNVNGWRDKSDNQAAQFGGISAITGRTPAIIVNYPEAPSENKFADWDPDGNFARNDNFVQISGRVDYDVSDVVKLTSLTSYSELNRDASSDVDGTQFTNYTVRSTGLIHSFYQELRVTWDISQQWRLMLGANYGHDYIEDEANPTAPLGFSSSSFTAAETPGTAKIDRAAVFGTLDWEATDTVTLQGGLRYTNAKRKYEGCTLNTGADRSLTDLVAGTGDRLRGFEIPIATGDCATLGPPPDFLPGPVVGKLDEDSLSFRANVNWQVAPRALLYANVSRGFKEGVFPISGATFSFSLQPAVQEEVLAYETGFKLGLADRRVQINGAVFMGWPAPFPRHRL